MKTITLLLLLVILPGCAVQSTTFVSDIPAIATWGQKAQQDLVLGQKCNENTKEVVVIANKSAQQVRKGVVRQESQLSKVCK